MDNSLIERTKLEEVYSQFFHKRCSSCSNILVSDANLKEYKCLNCDRILLINKEDAKEIIEKEIEFAKKEQNLIITQVDPSHMYAHTVADLYKVLNALFLLPIKVKENKVEPPQLNKLKLTSLFQLQFQIIQLGKRKELNFLNAIKAGNKKFDSLYAKAIDLSKQILGKGQLIDQLNCDLSYLTEIEKNQKKVGYTILHSFAFEKVTNMLYGIGFKNHQIKEIQQLSGNPFLRLYGQLNIPLNIDNRKFSILNKDDGILLSEILIHLLAFPYYAKYYNYKTLSDKLVDFNKFHKLAVQLIQLAVDSEKHIISLTIPELVGFFESSGINQDLWGKFLVNISDEGRKLFLKKVNSHIQLEEIPIPLFAYISSIPLEGRKEIKNTFLLDAGRALFTYLIAFRFMNPDFGKYRNEKGRKIEKELLPEFFSRYGCYIESSEIEKKSKQKQLKTMKSRGEIDGIFISSTEDMIWVIEAKQTPLPPNSWINKEDLGYIISWIKCLTEGRELSYKSNPNGKKYRIKNKIFSIKSKTRWVRENYEKLGLSTLPKSRITFIPIVITDCFPEDCKINGVQILTFNFLLKKLYNCTYWSYPLNKTPSYDLCLPF